MEEAGIFIKWIIHHDYLNDKYGTAFINTALNLIHSTGVKNYLALRIKK